MGRRASSSSSKRKALSQDSLGIDLVEYKKARAFYSRHKNRLTSYFAKAEISMIENGDKPHETLAMILAAKEAVFKSSNAPWMGTHGFREILIVAYGDRRLSFRLRGNFKRSFTRRRQPELTFLKCRDYVIAKCSTKLRNRPECVGN